MYKRIVSLLTREQRRRGMCVLVAVVGRAMLDFAGVAALFPVLVAFLQPGSSRKSMLMLCGGVLFFVIAKNVLVWWLARIQSRYQLDVYKDISQRMFRNYYKRGMLFMKEKGSTLLSHEVNYAGYVFCQGILSSLFHLCGDGVLVFLMTLALFIWKPLAGLLLSVAFLSLSCFYIKLVRKRMQLYGQKELEARRRQARTTSETFRGYVEIEIAHSFDSSLAAFGKGADAIADSRLHTETCQLFPLFLSELAVILGFALLALSGQAELGLSGGVFAIAAFRLVPAVRAILNAYGMLQNASRTLQVVAEGLVKPTEADSPSAMFSFTFERGMEIRHLSYAFADGHWLFRNLNWNIRRGEWVGIRGASGSGKSTLFNLMLGFLQPREGTILIDGCELNQQNRVAWHQIVGYVPQEIFIADGTLLENIALGQACPNRKKAADVLQQVQLGEWLQSLPEGLDTRLGENGSRLSGGQKQRIGIARALYKDARILFFDEATSALDSRTESEINQALYRLSEYHHDLTIIIIAHRESSLALCDCILDLEPFKGGTESGNPCSATGRP